MFGRARRALVLSAFEFFSDKALRHVVAAGGRHPFAQDARCNVLLEFDEDEDAASRFFEAAHADGLVLDGVMSQSGAHAAEL